MSSTNELLRFNISFESPEKAEVGALKGLPPPPLLFEDICCEL
jgi:hypothetical protein